MQGKIKEKLKINKNPTVLQIIDGNVSKVAKLIGKRNLHQKNRCISLIRAENIYDFPENGSYKRKNRRTF